MSDAQTAAPSSGPALPATGVAVVDAPGWGVVGADPPVGGWEAPPEPPAPEPNPPAGFGRRLVRGRAQDPSWVRPSLVALLVGTGLLYAWGLGSSGWAKSFNSAAVQAGTWSWKAVFFGSFDASNFITVD